MSARVDSQVQLVVRVTDLYALNLDVEVVPQKPGYVTSLPTIEPSGLLYGDWPDAGVEHTLRTGDWLGAQPAQDLIYDDWI